MSYDKNTSVPGIQGAGSQQDAALRKAKAGNPKGASGTYTDRPEAQHQGITRIPQNAINKPATPRPYGSTADTGREMP